MYMISVCKMWNFYKSNKILCFASHMFEMKQLYFRISKTENQRSHRWPWVGPTIHTKWWCRTFLSDNFDNMSLYNEIAWNL